VGSPEHSIWSVVRAFCARDSISCIAKSLSSVRSRVDYRPRHGIRERRARRRACRKAGETGVAGAGILRALRCHQRGKQCSPVGGAFSASATHCQHLATSHRAFVSRAGLATANLSRPSSPGRLIPGADRPRPFPHRCHALIAPRFAIAGRNRPPLAPIRLNGVNRHDTIQFK
jgi:hypothetical protein